MTYYELYHHGILGQKWGVRRYQNKDGSLTAAGERHRDALDKKKNGDKVRESSSKKKAIVGTIVFSTALAGAVVGITALSKQRMHSIEVKDAMREFNVNLAEANKVTNDMMRNVGDFDINKASRDWTDAAKQSSKIYSDFIKTMDELDKFFMGVNYAF